MLNVKRIRLRSLSDHAVTMRLSDGAARRDGWRHQAPSTVEIVNPETPICTLDSEDARLEMDLIVETGRGYVPAESKGRSTHWADSVDAIFSPVEKVNYLVENTRWADDQLRPHHLADLDRWHDHARRGVAPGVKRARAALPDDRRLHWSGGGDARGSSHRGWTDELQIPQKIYDTPIESWT